MTRKPKPMHCYYGAGTDEELDELVTQGLMTLGDADAIREFREFLREKAANDDK